MFVDQASWEGAVRHLFEDAYPFDATGPRRYADWILDVIALMNRAVPDPRGWAGLDDAAHHPEREEFPMHPFADHPPEYIKERIHQIDRVSAENLLLALTDDCCTLSNLQRFEETEEELRVMARAILERYGDEATYHTNVSRPGAVPETLDFTTTHWGYNPLSDVYSEDCGLIVVSGTEVGLFWNFSDY
ncbi:hypothetical protein ACWDF1_09830 [Streptomyces coelicoflavus]|uniref:hypothetical protein n=1 Tax=Streptomyces coelicoflavus TaxID=285562 RepID=UPI000D59E118|nr:hypothetical protein [Streptomyces coelicoflavus]